MRPIQGLGFGQCELEMDLSGGGEFIGRPSRHPCTLPFLLSPLPLEPSCLPAFLCAHLAFRHSQVYGMGCCQHSFP